MMTSFSTPAATNTAPAVGSPTGREMARGGHSPLLEAPPPASSPGCGSGSAGGSAAAAGGCSAAGRRHRCVLPLLQSAYSHSCFPFQREIKPSGAPGDEPGATGGELLLGQRRHRGVAARPAAACTELLERLEIAWLSLRERREKLAVAWRCAACEERWQHFDGICRLCECTRKSNNRRCDALTTLASRHGHF